MLNNIFFEKQREYKTLKIRRDPQLSTTVLLEIRKGKLMKQQILLVLTHDKTRSSGQTDLKPLV